MEGGLHPDWGSSQPPTRVTLDIKNWRDSVMLHTLGKEDFLEVKFFQTTALF